jgi:hypothetical protein
MKGKSVHTRARRSGAAATGIAAEANSAATVQSAQGAAARTGADPGQGGAASAATSMASLGPDLQAHIGRQLRAAFQQIIDEPVPDRFVTLIESLSRKRDD